MRKLPCQRLQTSSSSNGVQAGRRDLSELQNGVIAFLDGLDRIRATAPAQTAEILRREEGSAPAALKGGDLMRTVGFHITSMK
jgi:hypothetical protein